MFVLISQAVVYSLVEHSHSGLDSAILEAIIHKHTSVGKTAKVLKQAIMWDRVEIARTALQDASNARNANLVWTQNVPLLTNRMKM